MWELESATYTSDASDLLLREGWEPFMVDDAEVYYRRQIPEQKREEVLKEVGRWMDETGTDWILRKFEAIKNDLSQGRMPRINYLDEQYRD